MKRIILFLILIIALSGCVGEETSAQVVIGSSIAVDVEIADTPDERGLGLMHRESLDEDAGMLFVFEGEDIRVFWMKNTLIPLDMIYINSSMAVVEIRKNVQPCELEPCPTYVSENSAMYVLEVNAGFSEEQGIVVGDEVKIIL